MSFRNPSGKPAPTLQDWRITSDNRLILFLALNGRTFTRRIRLGQRDAGLYTFDSADGSAIFARGRKNRPSTLRLRGGKRLTLFPLKGVFVVQGTVPEMQAMAAYVWPIMNALTESVPAASEHQNAAD